MTLASLDRRTRREADLRTITPDELFGQILPEHVERHGAMVAAGMAALSAPPLTVEVGERSWSLTTDGDTLVVGEGDVDGALVVTFAEADFSEWAQLRHSLAGFMMMGGLGIRGGDQGDLSTWDSLWLALREGWPVVDDDLQFLDRQGELLDLGQSFGPEDDPADIAQFLREAGYLHLRGWLDPDDMARIAGEIDDALPRYTEGDDRSWWAEMEDGTRRCVRLLQFLPHSPTTAAVLQSDRWDQLRRTLAGDDELVQGRPGDHVIEALVKPPGVVRGISDVSFHRDCILGGHPYGCSGVDIGIAVTGSDESTGRLRVVAGSHRVGIPVALALTDPYLPVVSVWTEPGDLTVHLSCTLHESTPPVTAGRKVMYAPFSLAPRADDPPRTDAPEDPGLRARLGTSLADDHAPSSQEAWAGRSV